MKHTYNILFCLVIILSSCDKLPNDGIPTYIKIANPKIETKANQGAAVHYFSDLWLESQGKDLGAYEYPTVFGAYIAGEQEIALNAGIFYNGMLVPNIELGRVLGKNGKPIEFYAGDKARKENDLSWSKWGKRFNFFLNHILCFC